MSYRPVNPPRPKRHPRCFRRGPGIPSITSLPLHHPHISAPQDSHDGRRSLVEFSCERQTSLWISLQVGAIIRHHASISAHSTPGPIAKHQLSFPGALFNATAGELFAAAINAHSAQQPILYRSARPTGHRRALHLPGTQRTALRCSNTYIAGSAEDRELVGFLYQRLFPANMPVGCMRESMSYLVVDYLT